MREQWIDRAKGIAMLMVVLGHTYEKAHFVYGIHLVIFFILAGYLLKQKEVTAEFIAGKFKRLMVPYFYTCLAIAATDAAKCVVLRGGGSTVENVTAVLYRDIVRTYFASGAITAFGSVELGTRIGAVWFLPAMFFAVLIFQLLLQYARTDIDLAMWSGGIALLGYISAKFIWLPFSIQSGMFAVFFLWIGYAVRRKKWLEKLQARHYIAAQLIFLAGIFRGYSDISFVTADMVDPLLSVVSGLSGCVVLYGILRLFSGIRKEELFSWIGKNSLTVLCVHLYDLETIGDICYKASLRLVSAQPLQEAVCAFLHILIAVGGAWLIEMGKNAYHALIKTNGRLKPAETGRDETIDILRGILLILMMVAHFSVNESFRRVIYSFHMPAFILLSGYLYHKPQSLCKGLLHMVRTFGVPYLVFSVLHTAFGALQGESIKASVRDCVLGMSFSRRFFSQAASIGFVYFILLLFVVRVIYLLIDRVSANELQKAIMVLACSVAGVLLGVKDFWLPWSADAACYAVMFYYAGVLCRKYDVFTKVRRNDLYYFVLSSIWAYGIYAGRLELAVRCYGAHTGENAASYTYSLSILSAVAGTLVICRLAAYISQALPLAARVCAGIGKASMTLLVTYTLLNDTICGITAKWFAPDHFMFLVVSTVLMLALALLIHALLQCVKKVKRAKTN